MHQFLIILLHFTITSALKGIYVDRGCVAKISHNGVLGGISLPNPRSAVLVGSIYTVEIDKLQIRHWVLGFLCEPVVKHLPAPHYLKPSWWLETRGPFGLHLWMPRGTKVPCFI